METAHTVYATWPAVILAFQTQTGVSLGLAEQLTLAGFAEYAVREM